MKVVKDYPLGFDVFSMFRWFYIVSQNIKCNITVLYELQNSRELSDIYKVSDLTFFKEVEYTDGYGLDKTDSYFLCFNRSFFIVFIFYLLLL